MNLSQEDRILISKAANFADNKHRGQTRKYTGVAYITHCESVARGVRRVGGTPAMIAAAWLHDTIEDTDTTIAELVENFGQEITNLVMQLTDVYTSENYPHMNRAARKEFETERLATISPEAKLIKLADIADNTKDIVEHDPEFAVTYFREKAALLEVLVD